MKKFNKKIDGGLELDVQIEKTAPNKLTDAINVSTHNFDRQRGELNSCLGFSCDSYVIRSKMIGRTVAGATWTFTDTMDFWEAVTFVYCYDAGDTSFLVANLTTTDENFKEITFFYTVKRRELDPMQENAEDFADHVIYEITEIFIHVGELIDSTYSFCHYAFFDEKFVFILKDQFYMRVLIDGDELVPDLSLFLYDATKESVPVVTKCTLAPSLAMPSITRYCYRVLYTDQTTSHFSRLSPPVLIPSNYPPTWSSNEMFNWTDLKFAKFIKSNICHTVHVNVDNEENVARVELYAIRYLTGEGLSMASAIVEMIGDSPNGTDIDFVDGEAHLPTEVTASEIEAEVLLPPVFQSASVGCIKGETFFVGNTRENIDSDDADPDFDAWDARIWQFNKAAQPKAIDEAYNEYTVQQLLALTDKPYWLQNANCSTGKDGHSTDTLPLYTISGKHGAEGPNITIEFVKGKMECGGVYPDHYGASYNLKYSDYEVSSHFRGISPPSHTVGMENYNGKWYAKDTTDGIPKNGYIDYYNSEDEQISRQFFADYTKGEPEGHNYANPKFGLRYKALQHDSVYRIGIYFLTDINKMSHIQWCGDIRTPSMNVPGFRLFDNNQVRADSIKSSYKDVEYDQFVEMVMYPLFFQITIKSFPAPYTRARIVYAKRELNNRNVVMTGVFHTMHTPIAVNYLQNSYFKEGQKYCLPPLPMINKSKWFFGGGMGTCAFDFTNAGSNCRVNPTASLTSTKQQAMYKPDPEDDYQLKLLVGLVGQRLAIKTSFGEAARKKKDAVKTKPKVNARTYSLPGGGSTVLTSDTVIVPTPGRGSSAFMAVTPMSTYGYYFPSYDPRYDGGGRSGGGGTSGGGGSGTPRTYQGNRYEVRGKDLYRIKPGGSAEKMTPPPGKYFLFTDTSVIICDIGKGPKYGGSWADVGGGKSGTWKDVDGNVYNYDSSSGGGGGGEAEPNPDNITQVDVVNPDDATEVATEEGRPIVKDKQDMVYAITAEKQYFMAPHDTLIGICFSQKSRGQIAMIGDPIFFIDLVDGPVFVGAIYRAFPCQLNAMANAASKEQLFNFYAPEMDFMDDADNPFINSMAEKSVDLGTNHSICCHGFLSSLMPSRTDGSEIAAVNSYVNNNADPEQNTNDPDVGKRRKDNFRDAELTIYNSVSKQDDGTFFSGPSLACMETSWLTSVQAQLPVSGLRKKVSRGFNDGMFKTSNTIVPLKTAKYFIAWDKVSNGNSVIGVNIEIEAGSFCKTPVTLSEDIYQYFFPCSISHHPVAYPGNAHPKRIETFSVGEYTVVNVCPLWSGKQAPVLSYVISNATSFSEKSFVTECSDRSRNHMFSLYSITNNTPCGIQWTNRDAFITPLSDHCQQNFVDAENYKFKDNENSKSHDLSASAYIYDDAHVHFPYSLQAPSDGVRNPLSSELILVDYQSMGPNSSELVFPDVTWVKYNELRNDYMPIHNVGAKFPYFYKDGSINVSLPSGHFLALLGKNLLSMSKFFLKDFQTAAVKFDSHNITFDFTMGPNYTGYGGNGITFKMASDMPIFQEQFIVSKADGKLFLRDNVVKNNPFGDRYSVHYGSSFIVKEYLNESIDNASHVVLSTVRNKIKPFKSDYIEMSDWIEVADECEIHLNPTTHKPEEGKIITGFDMFVGIHKRMYLNAFYANGVGVRSDACMSSSGPIQMMFPTESMINLDIANPCAELLNPNNSTKINTPRMSHFAGYMYPASNYVSAKKDFSYNTVFSISDSSINQLVVNELIRREVFHTRLWYTNFNHGAGRFESFKVGNFVDLDRKYGSITGLCTLMDKVIAFQERAVIAYNPSQPTILSDAAKESRGLYIGSGDVLSSGGMYVTTDYGLDFYDRPYTFDGNIYWIDRQLKRIMRINDHGAVDIGVTHGVSSWVRNLLDKDPVAKYIFYQLEDRNKRLLFYPKDVDWSNFKFRKNVDRTCIEINESRDAFMSFITLGEPIVGTIVGKNFYVYNNIWKEPHSDLVIGDYGKRMFSDGRYDGYFYYPFSDQDPSIAMFINPHGDMHLEKEFNGLHFVRTGNSEARLILDFSHNMYNADEDEIFEINRIMPISFYPYLNNVDREYFEPILSHKNYVELEKNIDEVLDLINKFMNDKTLPLLTEAFDLLKRGNQYYTGVMFSKLRLKDLDAPVEFKKEFIRMGLAVPFGNYIDVPIDKVDFFSEKNFDLDIHPDDYSRFDRGKTGIRSQNDLLEHRPGEPVRGFGFHLNMRFQDFNHNSTNMFGLNFKPEYTRMGWVEGGYKSRLDASFNDFFVNYAIIGTWEKDTE